VRNRMLESGASGTVGGEGGNLLAYPAVSGAADRAAAALNIVSLFLRPSSRPGALAPSYDSTVGSGRLSSSPILCIALLLMFQFVGFGGSGFFAMLAVSVAWSAPPTRKMLTVGRNAPDSSCAR
jgi:hypothetical protein